MELGTLIAISALLVLVLILLALAIPIVPAYQRLVVFRLGRALGARGPGLLLLIPFIDRVERVYLHERYFDVEPQTCITKNNALLSIDFLVYVKVINALPSVLEVVDFTGEARGIAITTLRALVGDIILDDVLSRRDQLNELLQGKLDDVTNRRGNKVTVVDIHVIIPPRDIQESMSRQMSADRLRRATVTEAEGQRQAAILRAEGFPQALDKIQETAQGVGSNTMSPQYLETLKTIGESEATNFVLPVELVSLLQPLVRYRR
jgi:regulator of protease activity HflC (stomatin/prohibitin superfamily)